MNDPHIDLATLRDLEETAGADFVKELADAFFEEAPGMLAELREAYAAGAAERFRRAAHSLKTNAKNPRTKNDRMASCLFLDAAGNNSLPWPVTAPTTPLALGTGPERNLPGAEVRHGASEAVTVGNFTDRGRPSVAGIVSVSGIELVLRLYRRDARSRRCTSVQRTSPERSISSLRGVLISDNRAGPFGPRIVPLTSQDLTPTPETP